ncbi:MAG: ribonuclease E/G [Clostridiales bacterium]|jgi:ribonuclease G|nr:ribonuclease E/G [Clostridiales bacterium]
MNRIIIDCGDTIRTAVTDGRGLVELLIDEREPRSAVGAIFAGVVRSVLPSQFAFVDVGLSRNGFLFLNDIKESRLYDPDGRLTIKPGSTLAVQVVKDETADKGAYLTTQLSFSGRLCILFNTGYDRAGVSLSRKITREDERSRLKAAAESVLPVGYDVIIRTNCEGRGADELTSEIKSLLARADNLDKRWRYRRTPCVIERDDDALTRNLRDLFSAEIGEVVINSESEAERARAAVRDYFDGAEGRVRCVPSGDLIADMGLRRDTRRVLDKKVWLASGGFLVIERTEACWVIDVNSGRFPGRKDHEYSALRLNLEAAAEIARQARLRNLGGIIIIDFIDMREKQSRDELLAELSRAFARDRISSTVVGMTALGLVEVTRKKTREPLMDVLGADKI